MKILVSCPFPDSNLERLRALGAEVRYEPDLTAGGLIDAIGDVAILVVASLRVSADAIAAARQLQMIVRTSSDVSNIAVEEASAEGIFVVNCPDHDAVAIAELMLGFIIALDRGIPVHPDTPPPTDTPIGKGLRGRSLGFMGYGAVARAIAPRARSFGMNVLAWSEQATPESAMHDNIEFCTWPRELARRSDIVAAYASPERGEHPLIDAEFVDNLRAGAYFVLVGTPAGLDDEALARAVANRGIRVAIDAYGVEGARDTVRFRSTLASQPGVILTRQLGYSTRQAALAAADETVRTIERFLVSGEVLHCVNLMERSPATWQLLLRLRDAVGVMASVMDVVRADGINAEEITTRVFRGARAVSCMIALDERPTHETLEAIERIAGVLHFELRAMV